MEIKATNKLTRRQAIGLIGKGALAVQFTSAFSNSEQGWNAAKEEELYYLSIVELGKMIKAMKISSVEITLVIDCFFHASISVRSFFAGVSTFAM